MIKVLIFTMTLLFLQACSIKDAPPQSTYTLQKSSVAAVTHSRYANRTIKVSFPQTVKTKISDRMSYSYSPSEQGVYQNSKWSNNIGKLLQGSCIDTLDQSGLFKAVLPYESTASENLRLESNIYDFSHYVRENASYAIVSMRFTLIDTYSGKVMKTKRFTFKEATTTTNAKGYAEATNRALAKMGVVLVEWLSFR